MPIILYGVLVSFLIFLLGGAGTIAYGWRQYLPRGKFYTLNLPLTSDPSTIIKQSIHVYCEGPYNISLPIIFIEVGGGGHSTSDVYGLMNYFSTQYQRRVCAYDYPATGWTRLDIPLNDNILLTNLPLYILDAIASDEPGPYIFIGTMDDGPSRIYTIALEKPEKVISLVPLQYSAGEFINLMNYHKWTPQETAPVTSATLAGRRDLGDVIRFLAVQWGFMPLFVGGSGSDTYIPANLEPEKNFLNLYHEGQWDMQVRILESQVLDPINTVLVPTNWESNRSLNKNIPVLALGNSPTNLNEACEEAEYPLDSDDCLYYQYSILQDQEYMYNMTIMSDNSVYINCNNTEVINNAPVCNGDWLGSGSTIYYVGDLVMKYFGNITI